MHGSNSFFADRLFCIVVRFSEYFIGQCEGAVLLSSNFS